MADPHYRYDPGPAVLACVAAGPIFLFWLSIGAFVLSAMNGPVPLEDLAAAPLMLLALPMVIAAGFVLAALPVAIGTAAMTRLAIFRAAFAAPILWAAVGGTMAGSFGLVIADAMVEPSLLLAATGASCAALARRGLRLT